MSVGGHLFFPPTLPALHTPPHPLAPALARCSMALLRLLPSSAHIRRARHLLLPLLPCSFLPGLMSRKTMDNWPAFYLPPRRDLALPLTDVSSSARPSLIGVESPEITLPTFTNGKAETRAEMDAGPWARAI